MHLLATPAFAYVGPGAGVTLLGALWGVILAIVMAIGGVLIWPLMALRKKHKSKRPSKNTDTAQAESALKAVNE